MILLRNRTFDFRYESKSVEDKKDEGMPILPEVALTGIYKPA